MNLKSRLKEVFTSGDTYTVLTLLKALIDEMEGIEFATPENIAELHEDFDELEAEFNALAGNSLKAFITTNDIESLTNDELNTIHNRNYGFVVTKKENGDFIYIVSVNGEDFLEFFRFDSEERNIYGAWYEFNNDNNEWELSRYEYRAVTSLYDHIIRFNYTEVEKGELISNTGGLNEIHIVTNSRDPYSGSFRATVGKDDVVSIGCVPRVSGGSSLNASSVSFNPTDNEFEISTGLVGGYVIYSGVTTFTDTVTAI